ncbi:zinc finger containing protein [Pyrenophora tritici-repentis Pt-1C-BFP]|uniref:Zinc finger containing protein n=1 Tax=Pyrenophora tritici-repentis (strain Pt-1C-BFP) TaxID=426418 RepID=B2WBR7_PYRTR|nr:zinc finger containing protein [Pyrenophora tritici-repentis Pt-1C-BFP]EDU49999.1 zinc finger containing protein [Pyrenophora tritici-repentis Pt-1C-BFP]
MAEYAQYPASMPQDFELYSNTHEHHMEFHHSHPFMSSAYGMEHAFSASYDPMAPLTEIPRPQDLQYHYDAIVQGVRPYQYHTPAGSPHSISHSFHEMPPVLEASSESGASVSSSAMGSPAIVPQFNESWNPMPLGHVPGYEYTNMATEKSYVDPNLIQPFAFAPPSPYPEIRTTPSPYFPVIEQPPSPALSNISSYSQRGSTRHKKGSASPYLHTQQYRPYPQGQRRSSVNSLHSQHSGTSRKSGSSYEVDDETREKGMCPLPECGRVFKDLKAHMLTHQNERPEKCPIAACEYHVKGFARKYDKNRHTLTHYKGTMVCGFCPGSGSAAEKSFNRADVFKRHLTTVHGVEQNPPNSRKRSPSNRKVLGNAQPNVAGTCSTCSVTFANAQEFYEHLDDCVGSMQHVGGGNNANQQQHYSSSRVTKPGPRTGLTFSKGGVAIVSSGRKKRKNYPVSWGCAADKMKMKKRVLCVYDGPRRLWKDDLMLDQEYEVRLKMSDGKSYVTDLDVQTINRAEAMHNATIEEKGPLMPERVACAVTAQVSNANWFGGMN